jgi:hypothetical protein
VPRLEPHDHRILIALFDHILVVPLLIRFIDLERPGILRERGFEVAQLETVVVVKTFLDHADELALGECYELALVGFLTHEVEWHTVAVFCGEVEDGDLVVFGLQHHRLHSVHHCQRVHPVLELMFEDDEPLGIDLYQDILPYPG